MTTITDTRKKLLGLAHLADKKLGLDDQARRDVQREVTGQQSCRELSDTALRRLLWHYNSLGADLRVPGPQAVARLDRPTMPQLREIERLAFARGFANGLDDRRLLGFVRRTAQVDHPRFLSRAQASNVITGLRKWADPVRATRRSPLP